MLNYLDENEKRWQNIAEKQASQSATQQASEGCSGNVTCASIEVTRVCRVAEPSLSVDSCQQLDNADQCGVDSSSPLRVDCSVACCADDDKLSPNCCDSDSVLPAQCESRRGSLPTSDTIPLVFAAIRRRNSAPVIGQSAALAVKRHLLATLAEHTLSFCTQNSSTDSGHLFSADSHTQYHRAAGSARPAWVKAESSRVGIEGRPRDRRSNSHALVFQQCLFAGRLSGRRFSSPTVGNDHWLGSDLESVPLLTPVIPSAAACSQSALVNWFVELF